MTKYLKCLFVFTSLLGTIEVYAECQSYRYSKAENERNTMQLSSCPSGEICSAVIVCDENPAISFYASCPKVNGQCPDAESCYRASNSRGSNADYEKASEATKQAIQAAASMSGLPSVPALTGR